ncbi:MAG: CvpA family protein [Pseudomonadota bacterium]
MDGFTLIDGIVGALIVVSALLAYSRGFTRELLAIAGWVVAAIAGVAFLEQAQPLVRQIPYVGDRIIGDSCELSVVGSFGAVFLVALVIVSLFTPLLSTLVQRSPLASVDQGLGFLFGVARGVLLVAIAFFIYETVVTTQNIEIVDQSRSAAVFANVSDTIQDQDPEAALGWVQSQYDTVMASCVEA